MASTTEARILEALKEGRRLKLSLQNVVKRSKISKTTFYTYKKRSKEVARAMEALLESRRPRENICAMVEPETKRWLGEDDESVSAKAAAILDSAYKRSRKER